MQQNLTIRESRSICRSPSPERVRVATLYTGSVGKDYPGFSGGTGSCMPGCRHSALYASPPSNSDRCVQEMANSGKSAKLGKLRPDCSKSELDRLSCRIFVVSLYARVRSRRPVTFAP